MIFSKYFDEWSKKYYSSFQKVGKQGDFYTCVSVGELFAFTLAKHFVNLVKNNEIKLPCDVIEIGANEGYLLKDFYTYLKENNEEVLKDINFYIIEPYEKLRQIQKKNCQFAFKHIYLHELKSKNAFFLANELFDSFACELVQNNNFAFISEHKITFKEHSLNHEVANEFLKSYKEFQGELCPNIYDFLYFIKQKCEKLYFLSFDYFKKHNDFTIRIFKKHNLYSFFEVDLKEFYANSDITFSINYYEFIFYLEKLGFAYNAKKQSMALIDFKISDFTSPKHLMQMKNLFFSFSDNFYCFEFKN
ncbi:SAM-dependent methyltransferase [Campylobacter canadensis]|uniref:SAM-dependent methyltransferase n=1 Tax=Campylobacter canadensis TaxID=449520 RepID=A0ABS7WSB7_9BACT|nr:SAM-dependent methyltransferase [Campylobacter canadensis]MBZ7987655.1 SAM-dependent methyltransferase [Campylobacter canadensis]MBZ7995022.1 SAM-dependent methyltransferase [Campylobacter canadensis]MBZ7996964.1 SAM-dependent methyltransferase [Campylobacter canadensis]MBZ7998808.1 SAM-dependent methyltransferase [Campylobacter canadensis]MBZ8000443.1 SAM-dependent methyltransferase [Campylobacter canadensis]